MNRLLGLEIDEVSLVDRPANQHGLVTITKRDEDPDMDEVYDAQGNALDPEQLGPGDVVFDGNGDRHVLVDDELAAQLEAEGIDLDSLDIPDDVSSILEEEMVGKAGSAVTGGASSARQVGRRIKTELLGHTPGRRVGKSLGEGVLADLSKAYTDSDRDRVVSETFGKAEERISKAEARAFQAEQIAKALAEEQELGQYVELAKNYELPVDPADFGPILQTIAKSGLSEDELELVDRLFHAAGQAIYAEQGFTGQAPSYVMDQVAGYAQEVVGKADISEAQATVALFEANPGAYAEYLSEQR